MKKTNISFAVRMSFYFFSGMALCSQLYAQGYVSNVPSSSSSAYPSNPYTSNAYPSGAYPSSPSIPHQTPYGSGSQTITNSQMPKNFPHHPSHHHEKGFSFAINGLDNPPLPIRPPYGYDNTHRHSRFHQLHPYWVSVFTGESIPPHAVVGGAESGRIYYICRADYRGGVHPGKVAARYCHFSYGGHEITVDQYQVLASRQPLTWVAGNFGYIPMNAYPGGHENGKPFFICQAQYKNSMQPGKMLDQNCHISWHGREIALASYNVLVST